MTRYGFSAEPEQAPAPKQPAASVKLPTAVEKKPDAADLSLAVQAGRDLGFVSREASTRRKPGPKRSEPQDKITIAGPKRVIDRLKAYCDQHGVSYHEAIEILLNHEGP